LGRGYAVLQGVTSLASEEMNIAGSAEIVKLTEPDVVGDGQRQLEVRAQRS
jgi:hypothetical protein